MTPPAESGVDRQFVSASTELRASLVVLAIALVATGLAWRGVFASAVGFPVALALVLSGVTVISLRRARGVLRGPRLGVAGIVFLVCLALPLVHREGLRNRLESLDRRGNEALAGEVAPDLPFLAGLEAGERTEPGRLDFNKGATVVNFWATWCAPCVSELPLLEKYRTEEGVRVIGVLEADEGDLENDLSDLGEFLDEHRVGGLQLLVSDEGSAFSDYRVWSMPTTVLIGAEGRILEYGAGTPGTARILQRAAAMPSD